MSEPCLHGLKALDQTKLTLTYPIIIIIWLKMAKIGLEESFEGFQRAQLHSKLKLTYPCLFCIDEVGWVLLSWKKYARELNLGFQGATKWDQFQRYLIRCRVT